MEQLIIPMAKKKSKSCLHVAGSPAVVVPFNVPTAHECALFEQTYRNHFASVKRYARRFRLPVHTSAEDIAQEVFARLWAREGRLNGIDSVEDYLFAMVRNRLINENDKAVVRKKATDYFSFTSPCSAETTASDLRCREIMQSYNAGVGELPPRTREAYELKEVAGLKNDAIARKMGISHSMAKQHLGSATKKIKAYMDAQGCY